MVRVTTAAFALAFLLAAPASSRLEKAPTYYYRVTGGSMTIETRETGENTGVERLRWSVAPHKRGARPAPGFPAADGSGGPRTFQLHFPVRGTYTYDYDCKESFALAPGSRASADVRRVGSRVRLTWGLNPRRRAGYVVPECRPKTNNALRYFEANQSSMAVTLASGGLGKSTFSVNVRGSQIATGTTLTWQLSLSVKRIGHR